LRSNAPELLEHVIEIYKLGPDGIGDLVDRFQIDAPDSRIAGHMGEERVKRHEIMAVYQGTLDRQGRRPTGFAGKYTTAEWTRLRDALGGMDAVSSELQRRSAAARTLHKNAADRYLLVRDLPRSLQAALREVEYGKKDIEVKARETFDPSAAGGSGRRGFVAACKMDDSGTYEIEWGSWGGENPFTRTVEGYRGDVPIPPEIAFIRGSIGGGHPTNASVYVSPHAMNPALLTAGPEVTPKEAKILAIFKQLKSSYRPEYLDRLQEKENELASSRERKAATDRAIESLIERGFLSRNKAGSISITTEGRNAADPRQP
jgi:hypothetical protein